MTGPEVLAAGPDADATRPLRDRLDALLDSYDHDDTASGADRFLAAYVRACLSGLDATRMRVARELDRRAPGPNRTDHQHRPWSTSRVAGSRPPGSSAAPLYGGGGRDDAIQRLADLAEERRRQHDRETA